MPTDPHLATAFYASPCGLVACALVRERLLRAWPALHGQSALGIGFAAPYLEAWAQAAARCVACIPGLASPPAAPAPGGPPCRIPTCTIEDDSLPFADLSFDRILLVHGLETADNARALLREAWRVLKDDGRLLIVAPNRMGLWARFESTPFGHGQPYSPGQIGRLLASSLFRIEWRDTALHLPPLQSRAVLRSARAWERGGRWLMPQFAGVCLVEAVKDTYAGVPLTQSRRRLVFSRAA